MRKRRIALVAVVVAAMLSMAATCKHNTPRHDTRVNLQVLVTALHGLQDSEHTVYNEGSAPDLTLEKHRAFNAEMVKVWDAADAAVALALAWRPGEPVPPQLSSWLEQVRVLTNNVFTVFGKTLPDKFNAVWDALAKVALAFITPTPAPTGGGL